MPKVVLKSYVSGTAATDAVLNPIMPVTGRLSGILATIRYTVAAAATENVLFEFSQQSTSQFVTTDAQGVIGYAGAGTTVSTAGNVGVVSIFIPAFEIPVQAGSRLYVHRSTTAAFSAVILDVVWVIN